MQEETTNPNNLQGLTTQDVTTLRKQYGKNIFHAESSSNFLRIAFDTVKEPMFVLLVVACSLYFILGEIRQGILMLIAMILVTTVSLVRK